MKIPLPLFLCLFTPLVASGQIVSRMNEILSLEDTNRFVISTGHTNYYTTFGTIHSNIASRLPASSGSGVTVSNASTLYVSTGGNDATARRGRPDLPWAKPTAAKTAAVAGDTIVVGPGIYSGCSNLFKNGVDWQGLGIPTLVYTNLTNDTGVGIFDDRFSGTVTSKISGFSFRYSTGLETTNSTYQADYGPTNTAGCIVITNMLSEVTLNFDRIDYQDLRLTYAGALWLGSGTNCFIHGNVIQDINLDADVVIGYDPDLMENVSVASEAIGVYWLAGDHHVEVERVMCRRNSLYAVAARPLEFGNLWFKSDYLFGQFYCYGTTNNWRVWATFKELEVNTNSTQLPGAITMENAGKIYIRGEKVEEKGTRGDPTGGTTIRQNGLVQSWINLQKASAGSHWLNLAGSGTCWLDCLHYEDVVGITQGFLLTGGSLRASGQEAKVASATGSAIVHFSGDAVFSGLRLSATNSSGSPVIVNTNGLVLQNCTLLAKPSSFSIRATNTQSAILQGSWSNTDASNLNFLVGPWTIDSNLR